MKKITTIILIIIIMAGCSKAPFEQKTIEQIVPVNAVMLRKIDSTSAYIVMYEYVYIMKVTPGTNDYYRVRLGKYSELVWALDLRVSYEN